MQIVSEFDDTFNVNVKGRMAQIARRVASLPPPAGNPHYRRASRLDSVRINKEYSDFRPA